MEGVKILYIFDECMNQISSLGCLLYEAFDSTKHFSEKSYTPIFMNL